MHASDLFVSRLSVVCDPLLLNELVAVRLDRMKSD